MKAYTMTYKVITEPNLGNFRWQSWTIVDKYLKPPFAKPPFGLPQVITVPNCFWIPSDSAVILSRGLPTSLGLPSTKMFWELFSVISMEELQN